MRVLFVINAMGRGGAEVQVKDLAEAMVNDGHEVAMVVMLPYEEFEPELRAMGVHTFTLGLAKGVPHPRALLALHDIVSRFRPDVVHAHMFSATLLARVGLVAARRGGKGPALISTSHCREESSRARYLAYRATHRLADQWTSVSREGIKIHEAHGAIPPGHALHMPNGIVVERFAPNASARAATRHELALGHDDLMWLALGSFRDETKDYGTLLRAFAHMRVRAPRARLFLAGEGRLLEDKRALARSLGVESSTRFLGLRKDVTALLQAADAYVLSSQSEAMPIVLLEAAAAGLPIVTTDVGESADIVRSGGGRVVAPREHEALGEAMLEVDAMPEAERTALGARTRADVSRRFGMHATVARWLELYARLHHHRSSTR